MQWLEILLSAQIQDRQKTVQNSSLDKSPSFSENINFNLHLSNFDIMLGQLLFHQNKIPLL